MPVLIQNSAGATIGASARGAVPIVGDFPVVGDWDGDGKDTIAMSRDLIVNNQFVGQQWLLRNTNNVGGIDVSFPWGQTTAWLA